ncbi:MAG: helicase-related protein, partial [Candidatus Rokuibacteriota bacterium]
EYRRVTVVDTREPKRLELRVEVPVEEMARLGEPTGAADGSGPGRARGSIWSAIHPRLLELIHGHRSTLVFVNSRRIAERLAGALNELAGQTLALAHHGSIAREQRAEIEDRLKAGSVRALVATSSLELGIDMGTVDLVIQIEAPPSVASGMQRIGRAGHQIDAVSRGIIFPKFRGDLVACAAVTRQMHAGEVESTRYPRNPLDVLAQQIVAMTALDAWDVGALFDLARGAAPFAGLSRGVFEGVLDMLAGRYPSDEFAELKPRLTWDRVANRVVAREGARRVAVVNGGTIPDRGLYGVFLAGARPGTARVGELDEEMVFESRAGETFVLGASSWRIEEITHDRVLVSPAPGQPGKMPFWRGEGAGRPLELGREIGRLLRALRETAPDRALKMLVDEHDLDRGAAENLLQYLSDQAGAGIVPDDRTVVIERGRDELGDWRVCVPSPFGGRIHAPWAMAAVAKVRRQTGVDIETMWTDDGFVARFPDTDAPPDPALLLPDAGEVERLVLDHLGGTALFAARFREVAARALLLPRRR